MQLNISIPDAILQIIKVLYDAGGKPRLVGGVVRDAILGIRNTDIDLITIFDPAKVTDLLTSNNIPVKATGIKYGTVTAILNNNYAQITTLRLDKDCDGRHTKPKFTDDFEEDSRRRDFTINAMSYCVFEKKLYDYNGGYEDLIARRVVFIGNALDRIKEDYLRILRFFRFSDRFAKHIDAEALDACFNLRHGLVRLSKERVLMELKRLLESSICHNTLKIMLEHKILEEVITLDLSVDLLEEINNHATEVDFCTRFAALIHKNSSNLLKKKLHEMHFSVDENNRIYELVKFREMHQDLYKKPFDVAKNIFCSLWVNGIYNESYILISEFWKSKFFSKISSIISVEAPIFPIKGNDLISKGFEGSEIKTILEDMKISWIESDFVMSKSDLLNLLDSNILFKEKK